MPFQDRIPRRILPIPPTPAVLDQRVIDVGAIGQDHVSNSKRVLVMAVGLDCDFLPKGEGRGCLLGTLAVGLAFLYAVDAVETDPFGVDVVQDFDGVAIEDGDDGAGGSHTLK